MKQGAVIVLDENICFPELQKAMRDANAPCELLTDHFPRGTPDVEWLPQIGQRNWILLSKDLAIGVDSLEYLALTNAKLGAFFIRSREMPKKEIITCVLKALPKMLQIMRTQERPYLYKIYKDGSIIFWEKPGRKLRK
jgi:hypothetical protein